MLDSLVRITLPFSKKTKALKNKQKHCNKRKKIIVADSFCKVPVQQGMNSPLSTTAWTTIPRCRTKYTRLTLRVPTIRAISFLGHFLCSKAKICDLCSEVSCLYISNTKIINLPESSKGDSFFMYCRYRSSGLHAPAAKASSGVFHRLEPMKNRGIFCTSILKVLPFFARGHGPIFARHEVARAARLD